MPMSPAGVLFWVWAATCGQPGPAQCQWHGLPAQPLTALECAQQVQARTVAAVLAGDPTRFACSYHPPLPSPEQGR